MTVLLVFLILTSIRERYKQDLDGIIQELGATSDKAGKFLEANYELTITSLEAWLLDFVSSGFSVDKVDRRALV